MPEHLVALLSSGDWFVYSCPWCPEHAIDAGALVRKVMERHLDQHIAAGDHLRDTERPTLRVVA